MIAGAEYSVLTPPSEGKDGRMHVNLEGNITLIVPGLEIMKIGEL